MYNLVILFLDTYVNFIKFWTTVTCLEKCIWKKDKFQIKILIINGEVSVYADVDYKTKYMRKILKIAK